MSDRSMSAFSAVALLCLMAISAAVWGEFGAFGDRGLGDGPADAAVGAGDQHDPALKVHIHGGISRRPGRRVNGGDRTSMDETSA